MPPARRNPPGRAPGTSGPVADAIMACVAGHGAARFWQIAAAAGVSNGPLGWYLHRLVAAGRLTRAARGVYMIPGTRIAEMPPPAPRPPGTSDDPAKASARMRARWAKLTPEQRRAATATWQQAGAAARRKTPQPPD